MDTAAFDTAELDTTELDTAALDIAELDTAPLDTAELDAAKLDTATLDTTGLDTAALYTAELDIVGYFNDTLKWNDEIRASKQKIFSTEDMAVLKSLRIIRQVLVNRTICNTLHTKKLCQKKKRFFFFFLQIKHFFPPSVKVLR